MPNDLSTSLTIAYILIALFKLSQIIKTVVYIRKQNLRIDSDFISFWTMAIFSCLLWPWTIINNIIYSYKKRDKR
jgi:hypothetical protein